MAKVSKKNWATPDGACTSCRARKIKCDREKPQCSSCLGDQHECIYSSPPKRVNHIKVLCESFDEIQDRLITMEKQLSRLTATLGNPNAAEQGGILEKESSVPNSTSFGHVVRDTDGQIERYHGPWTLLAQCRQLETDLMCWPEVSTLLTRMVHDTMRLSLDSFSAGLADMKMCLPPRQLLSVMVECFLKNADYATSIFDHQSLYHAIDRVYQDPANPEEKPWVLCFNLIILLTLGAEHPLQSEDPFVRPMLQAVHVAAGNSRLFMEPRLVSVQALALFSLFVQQCYTDNEALGDSIFAQACQLARQMGLPQPYGCTSNSILTPVEVDERQRVYQSLYIRNRYSTTASGGLVWLPNGVSSTGTVTALAVHWELAKLQDEVHRLLGAPDLTSSDRRAVVAQLREKLKLWQETRLLPSLLEPMTVDRVVLYLGFLGTRMYIGMESKETDREEVLDDCRLSCLLLIVSCTQQQNPTFQSQLHDLLHKLSSSREKSDNLSQSSRASTPSSSSSSSHSTSDRLAQLSPLAETSSTKTPPATTSPLLPLHRLAKVFPITAIFMLGRHILGVSPNGKSSTPFRTDTDNNSDICILKSLLLCFQRSPPFLGVNSQPDSCSYRLGQALDHLVHIIHTMTFQQTSPRALVSKSPNHHMETNEHIPRDFTASQSLPEVTDLSRFWYAREMTGHTPMDISMSDFQSAWTAPQDSLSSSTMPLLSSDSSIYTPAMEPTPIMSMSNTPLDLSEFFSAESDGQDGWNVVGDVSNIIQQIRPPIKRRRTNEDKLD
ncbi:uncharacterized protein N7511_010837 [Penicillium nucicola]|uniref:uncharacterized protein n=1 Tax=Penicillium nucicola TaxID=1850975 RepID=UPI00254541B6|nr:uncharacterized protein N7511_010837 [Penicillium nucicola]KAJ5749141.1 hypothetical protein N7511_010837 [Penicillium nucicola]